jgi:hypothetical protein
VSGTPDTDVLDECPMKVPRCRTLAKGARYKIKRLQRAFCANVSPDQKTFKTTGTPMKFRHAILLLLLSGTIGLSAQSPSRPPSLGIDVSAMDRSVRPQDDFFRFVNGTWADKTPIPSDMSSYGAFPMLRDEASAAVREIVEGAAAQKAAAGTMTQKVGSYYASFMDTTRVESLGVQPLARERFAEGLPPGGGRGCHRADRDWRRTGSEGFQPVRGVDLAIRPQHAGPRLLPAAG